MRSHVALIYLFFSLVFYSHHVAAATYQFNIAGSSDYIVNGPFNSLSSLKSANHSGWAYRTWDTPGYPFAMTCNRTGSVNVVPGCPYNGYRLLISLVGDACEIPGATYNPQTGDCEAPPPDQCAEKVGQSEPFSKTGPRGDGFYDTVNVGGKNMGVTPDTACLAGCSAFLNQSCVFSLTANLYSCSGLAYFTGEQCTAGPTSVDTSPTVREEEPQVTNDEEPCVYVQDAEGRSHCVSKQSVEQEGQNCGSAGPAGSEQVRCFPKEAKRDESKIETEVTETPTADGGQQTVKRDVHTETKCTGNNQNCTTTTTTTTTTTKKDGSGTTTKTEVSCKGAKCGDDGKGGSGGGGGGNGTGDGEGEDEGGGDLPGNDDVPGFGDSLGSFTSKIQGSPIVGAVTSISFPDGGSCNMPSANVYMLGTISFDWFCQNANILDALYYVMLGVWALGAVRLFLEA